MNSLTDIVAFPGGPGRGSEKVYFNRVELNTILNIYGRMVAAGVWKDYAIEEGRETVAFTVFKRAADVPDYKIVKEPRLARKQGAYAIIGRGGMVIKRGQSLDTMLAHFRKMLMRLVD